MGRPAAFPQVHQGMWSPSAMYIQAQLVLPPGTHCSNEGQAAGMTQLVLPPGTHCSYEGQAGGMIQLVLPPGTHYSNEGQAGGMPQRHAHGKRGGQRHNNTAKKATRKDGEAAFSDAELEHIEQTSTRLLEKLRNGVSEKDAVNEFRALAFHSKISSHVAQHALAAGSNDECVILAGGLRGRVYDACKDPYANHVIQKLVELLPSELILDLVDEVKELGVELAKHKCGCRFLCRLLEHPPHQGELFDKILAAAAELCKHTYANYVMEHILVYGLPKQHEVVVAALCVDMFGHASDRNGSRIVEKALEKNVCSDAGQEALEALCTALLDKPKELQELAKNRFGCYVVKRLLSMPAEHSLPAVGILQLSPERTKFHTVVEGELRGISEEL